MVYQKPLRRSGCSSPLQEANIWLAAMPKMPTASCGFWRLATKSQSPQLAVGILGVAASQLAFQVIDKVAGLWTDVHCSSCSTASNFTTDDRSCLAPWC